MVCLSGGTERSGGTLEGQRGEDKGTGNTFRFNLPSPGGKKGLQRGDKETWSAAGGRQRGGRKGGRNLKREKIHLLQKKSVQSCHIKLKRTVKKGGNLKGKGTRGVGLTVTMKEKRLSIKFGKKKDT